MLTVSVRFPAFLFGTESGGVGGWVEVERELADDSVVSDLISDLVATYPGFRERVYNPGSGVVNDQIGIVLNDELLTFWEISQKRLSDRDNLLIQPVYSGG